MPTNIEPSGDPVRDLLDDWIKARLYVICDISTTITGDYRELVAAAQLRCTQLGIQWDESIIPDYVHEQLDWADTPEN